MRELTEVHRTFQREKSNVVLDDTQATSNVEPRMFLYFSYDSLGGVGSRFVPIRHIMFTLMFNVYQYKQSFLVSPMNNEGDIYQE